MPVRKPKVEGGSGLIFGGTGARFREGGKKVNNKGRVKSFPENDHRVRGRPGGGKGRRERKTSSASGMKKKAKPVFGEKRKKTGRQPDPR